MKQLNVLLERYYKRIGNRIVFLNGSSLNQFSLQMMEDLGFEGIDSSVLSRVIKGERLFTHKQLLSFCKILNIELIDQLELEQCVLAERIHTIDKGLFSAFDANDNEPTNFPKIVRLLRKNGYPLETVSTANFFQHKLLASNLDNQSLKILAQINNEKSRVCGEISQPEKIMSDMYQSNKIGKFVGEKFDDIAIKSMAYMNIGGGLYVAKQYKSSVDFLEHHFRLVDEKTQIEFLRTLMLDYSYLNDYQNFLEIRKRVSDLSDTKSLQKLDIFGSLQDSIARSLMIFGKYGEALKILNDSEQVDTTIHFRSQLMRTRLLTLYKIHVKSLKVDRNEFHFYYSLIKDKKYTPFSRHQKLADVLARKFEVLVR